MYERQDGLDNLFSGDNDEGGGKSLRNNALEQDSVTPLHISPVLVFPE